MKQNSPVGQLPGDMSEEDVLTVYQRQNNISPVETVKAGTVLCEKYEVLRTQEAASGDSDLYMCTDGTSQYLARIFRNRTAVDEKIRDRLLRFRSSGAASIAAIGMYQECPVVVFPCFRWGSLQGERMTAEQISREVLPGVVQGLQDLHTAGIVHGSVKPSNIMRNEDRRTVSLVDFGLAPFRDPDSPGLSPEYCAPETVKKEVGEEADWYALGITIYELLCGYTPFAGMQVEDIAQVRATQGIQFPDQVSRKMRDLITGLTWPAISAKGGRISWDKRWGYKEVKRWLAGEKVRVPGEELRGVGSTEIQPYSFCGKQYTDIPSLVKALAENWEDGKKEFTRSLLTKHLLNCRPEAGRKCNAAEEEVERQDGRDDFIFWQLLYELDPDLKSFCWKGRDFENLPAFGRDVLENLWNGDLSDEPFYKEVLSEKLLSMFLSIRMIPGEKLKREVQGMEDMFQEIRQNQGDLLRVYYRMGYALSGQKLLCVNGEQLRTVGELASYMKRLIEEKSGRFEILCHKLVRFDGTLDPQLEAWLIAIGKEKQIEQWRTSLET